jgi:hypothetical protein
MNTQKYHELLKRLAREHGVDEADLEFVENVSDWSAARGVPEPDRNVPVKAIPKGAAGCHLAVMEDIPDEVLEERIKVLSVRSALTNVALDRAGMLNSDKKKLAYLFLSEYARTLPEADDDLLADNWAFEEMERLGFFKE